MDNTTVIHQPSWWAAFIPSLQAGKADPDLGTIQADLIEGSLQSVYIHTGVAPPCDGGGYMAEVWLSGSGLVCL